MQKLITYGLPVLVGLVAGYAMATTLAKYQPWKKALELGAGSAV